MKSFIAIFPPRAGVGAHDLLALATELPEVRDALSIASQFVGVPFTASCIALDVCASDGFCGQLFEVATAVGIHAALERIGVTIRRSAVHCLGAYTAAIAAGCLDLTAGLSLLCKSIAIVRRQRNELTALARVPISDVLTYCKECEDLEVSTYNGPLACTVSGPVVELSHIESWASARGGSFRRLAGFGGWHFSGNEMLRAELATLTGALIERSAAFPIHFPMRLPRTVSTRNEVADAIVESAIQPVYWSDLLASLAVDDDCIFLEVGPKPVVAKFAPELKKQNRLIQARDILTLGTPISGRSHPNSDPAALIQESKP